MNKIKIMLMVITVFAAAGGVLAFKAHKFGVSYCTVATVNDACPTAATCPNAFTGKLGTSTDTKFCYTTIDDVANCNDQVPCSQTAFLTTNEQ